MGRLIDRRARAGTDLNQASRFHRRERRRSLAGHPELFQTHLYPIPTAAIDSDSFPERESPVTFVTTIRITGATPAGLIFEIGDATTAVAAYVDDDELVFRAGDSAGDAAEATYTYVGGLPVGLELDLEFSARPGDGRVRIWGEGRELARAEAANGSFPNGWAAASDGSFAAAVNGTTAADVMQQGAPSDFDVVEPLRVYVGQVPRHFV